MKFTPKPGWLLVLQDSDEVSHLGILFPDERRRKKASGLCIIHQESSAWIEDSMDGKHVLFEKWAWRDIVLNGQAYLLVPERAVFATIDGETDMNRQEFLEALQAEVKEIVEQEITDPNDDVSQDEADNVDARISGDIARNIVDEDLPDEEEGDEAEETDDSEKSDA